MKKYTIIFFLGVLLMSNIIKDESILSEGIYIQSCKCNEKKISEYIGDIGWRFQDSIVKLSGKEYFIFNLFVKHMKEEFYARIDSNKLLVIPRGNLLDSMSYNEVQRKEKFRDEVFLDFNYPNEKTWEFNSTSFFNITELKLEEIVVVKKDTIYEFKNVYNGSMRISHRLYLNKLKFSKKRGFLQLDCSLRKFEKFIIVFKCKDNEGKMIKL